MKGKLFSKYLGIPLAVWIALAGVPALALITSYVTGTASGTVHQAIILDACNVDVGTCNIADDKLSFSWDMDGVYQGSEYTATITLKNLGNQDIQVKVEKGEVTATGGNNQFEGSVEVPEEPITVPAGDTADFTVTVKIHPAEEPDEQFTININVVPAGE